MMDRVLLGHLLVQRASRSMPPPLSASGCLCRAFPSDRDLAGDLDRTELDSWLQVMGTDAAGHAAARAEALRLQEAGGLHWPDVFVAADAARRYAADHLGGVADLVLLRTSIAGDLVDTFLTSDMDGVGHVVCAGQRHRLDAHERVVETLGFEIVGADAGTRHSHHCHGLADDYARELGIGANAHGMIDDEGDACRAAEYANRDEVGTEPCVWLPWLVERLALDA